MAETPCFCSSGTSAFAVSASLAKASPAAARVPRIDGVPSSVSPMNATFTPPRSRMAYGGNTVRCVAVLTTFAARYWNFAIL
jgi:hypothetical protein